jgi:hypothetical protein
MKYPSIYERYSGGNYGIRLNGVAKFLVNGEERVEEARITAKRTTLVSGWTWDTTTGEIRNKYPDPSMGPMVALKLNFDDKWSPIVPKRPRSKTHTGIPFVDLREFIAKGQLVGATNEAGWLYAVQAGEWTKIGRTWEPFRRVKSIETSLPIPISVIGIVQTEDPKFFEHALLSLFDDKQVRGEWFALTSDDIELVRRFMTHDGLRDLR